MDAPNVTTEMAARCLSILRQALTPMTAAELAVKLHIEGSRETQRRHVRAVIKELRDCGCKIVATNTEGCWITEDDAIWKDYLEGRQIDAKRIIGDAARKQRAVSKPGQGLLFRPSLAYGN
jgi:hypothetical protein